MHPRQEVPEALVRLAAAQSGVVSREQALSFGLGDSAIDRLLSQHIWCRLARGVYLTAAVPPSWLALAWTGLLIGGDSARLGGPAAAHQWGLTQTEPRPIQILVPAAGSTPRVNGPWYFRRERPGARQPASYGNPPRTTIEDTVLDLIDDPDADPQAVVDWLTTAVQTRRTTPQRILKAASCRRFLRHRRLLEKLALDVAAGARSPLELDFLRLVERPHGLPVGHRQAARRGTEVDVVYKEYRLLIELDGRLGHDGSRAISRHAERQLGDGRWTGHAAIRVRRRARHPVRGGHPGRRHLEPSRLDRPGPSVPELPAGRVSRCVVIRPRHRRTSHHASESGSSVCTRLGRVLNIGLALSM